MAEVDMTTDVDLQEPVFTWNPNDTSSSTSTLQTLMDADAAHKNAHYRGILSVNNFKNPASPSAFDVNASLAQDAISMSENVSWQGVGSVIFSDASSNWSMSVCTSSQLQVGTLLWTAQSCSNPSSILGIGLP
ncbi:hypothetical protein F4821DRAFT_280608 [Hypoxylon rubiginosum]|uniref:Uncharacterized protein n=1 Tax=Hypoxylon rubiginosum TaxID=110542 RepID=A0ACC0CTY9_9PEZI|nr:hypothetical protein F4821DRAFT_280608 [Hypoxylon rubiginosum]